MHATVKDLRLNTRLLLAAIERGEIVEITYRGKPCARLAAASALALDMDVHERDHRQNRPSGDPGWIPVRIPVANYPQLRQLAWQLDGATQLSPQEAFNVYERNWRHLDQDALQPDEQSLLTALQQAFGEIHDV
ncbi:MAG: hypothetical protein ACQETO_06475 [Pseudomonadota bacterium]